MIISDWSSDVCSSDLSRGPDGLPMKTGPSLAVRGALARVNEIAACHRNVTQKTCNCHLPVITVPPDCHPYAMEQHPMRPRPIAALLATTMLALPAAAHAQAMGAEEAAVLRAELATLRAKVETLEARLDATTAEPVSSLAPSAPPDRQRVA